MFESTCYFVVALVACSLSRFEYCLARISSSLSHYFLGCPLRIHFRPTVKINEHFALDMLGYGKPEIRSPASVQLEDSRYFTSLGRTYEERRAALNTLVDEREDWKRHMSKALQLALRDIRNYTYSETNGIAQWVKNTRQKKVDQQMDSCNHTFQ